MIETNLLQNRKKNIFVGQYDNKLDVLWLAYGWLYSSIKKERSKKHMSSRVRSVNLNRSKKI